MKRIGFLLAVALCALGAAGSSSAQEGPTCFSFELGENVPEKVGFSMGTLAGATCSVVLHNDSAVVTSNLLGTVASLNGSLCIRLYDVGSLTGPVDYTITVTHP